MPLRNDDIGYACHKCHWQGGQCNYCPSCGVEFTLNNACLYILREPTKPKMYTEYKHPDRDKPETVRGDLLITTVRVESSPSHDHVHVWNRGGKSGVLAVTLGDGDRIALQLIPNAIKGSD